MGSVGNTTTFNLTVNSKPDEALARAEGDDKRIGISVNTWTIRNAETDKTMGMVRGIRSLSDAPPRVQFDIMSDLRKRGIDREDVMKNMGDFYVRDNKVVYAMDERYFRSYANSKLNQYENERRKFKERTDFINKLNDAGVTIVRINRR